MKSNVMASNAVKHLYLLTMVISRQILPVYNKPMIYYPLSTLMLLSICDVLITSTPEVTPCYEYLPVDGSKFGMNLSYKVQPSPEGLAQTFLLGQRIIGDETCATVCT